MGELLMGILDFSSLSLEQAPSIPAQPNWPLPPTTPCPCRAGWQFQYSWFLQFYFYVYLSFFQLSPTRKFPDKIQLDPNFASPWNPLTIPWGQRWRVVQRRGPEAGSSLFCTSRESIIPRLGQFEHSEGNVGKQEEAEHQAVVGGP